MTKPKRVTRDLDVAKLPLQERAALIFERILDALSREGRYTRIKETFGRFDEDRNGQLSPEELNRALHPLGIKLDETEMEAVFATFDCDGNGSISYRELVDALKRQCVPYAGRQQIARARARRRLTMIPSGTVVCRRRS